MAKKGRHPKGGRVTPKGGRVTAKGGRVTPKGTRPVSERGEAGPEMPREPSLLQDVRRALAAPHPLHLLQLVSALLSLDDDGGHPMASRRIHDEEESARDELMAALFGIERLETSAVLSVVAAFTEDDVERRRIRKVLAARQHALPAWITGLDDVAALRAVEVNHVLGDGATVVVGLRLPTGEELSVLVYIDHNLATSVKDAFLVPDGIDNLAALMRARTKDADTSIADIDLADAKARIVEAMAVAAITIPPAETETWPACQPLVRWGIRSLPDGGTGYQRPEWDEDARGDLIQRFVASPFARELGGEDLENQVDTLVWFGCDYGPGDPLRLSPVRIEILLADWIPRKIVADVDYLSQIPDVLRAFVRFGHGEAGIGAELTDETLAAVDEWEPTYQSAIRSPRPQGAAAILSAMHEYDPEQWPAVQEDES